MGTLCHPIILLRSVLKRKLMDDEKHESRRMQRCVIHDGVAVLSHV